MLLSGDPDLKDLSDSVQASTTAEIEALLKFPVRTARKIITRIPTEHCAQVLLEKQDKEMNIGTSYCHKMLWKTHGHLLRPETRRTDRDIDEFAMTLHRNSKVPLKEPDLSQAYLDAFTGRNIRWESLGMLFINCKHVFLFLRYQAFHENPTSNNLQGLTARCPLRFRKPSSPPRTSNPNPGNNSSLK